ncbi:MAG: hypothetical protein RR594_00410 [Clostridia bacterium]
MMDIMKFKKIEDSISDVDLESWNESLKVLERSYRCELKFRMNQFKKSQKQITLIEDRHIIIAAENINKLAKQDVIKTEQINDIKKFAFVLVHSLVKG